MTEDQDFEYLYAPDYDWLNDSEALKAMKAWIKRNPANTSQRNVRRLLASIPLLHLIGASLALILCLFFVDARVSHLGAGFIFTSTLITGITVIYSFSVRSKLEQLNPGFGNELPSKILRWLKDPRYENREDRAGLEWYQYHTFSLVDRLVRRSIVWELFAASFGTLVWGFADLLPVTNYELHDLWSTFKNFADAWV